MPRQTPLHPWWSWLLALAGASAAVAALAGAALPSPMVVVGGLLAGTIVLAVVGSVRGARRRVVTPGAPPGSPPGSPQALWQDRARAAAGRVAELAVGGGDPAVTQQLRDLAAACDPVLAAVHAMAGQLTVVDDSLAATHPASLAREIEEVQAARSSAVDPALRDQLGRTLAALDAQADSVDRLLRRRDSLRASLHATTVGLEGLAARAGELVALGPVAEDPSDAARLVDELTDQLEALRSGITRARNELGEA